MKYRSVLFLLASLPCCSGAQTMESYVFRHLGTENGLAGTRVTNMLQDHRGYLWISCGTDGLQRYDGERFLLFRHDPADSTSIPYGAASALFEDSRGTIWCAVGEKQLVVACNPDTRQFRRLNYEGQPLSRGCQFFEIQGRVHILCQKGIIRLDTAGKTVEKLTECTSNYYILGTRDSTTRTIWFWNDKGYHCWDPVNDRLYHAGNNPLHWRIFTEIPQQHGPIALYADHKGQIWISDWEWNSYRFEPENNTLVRYKSNRWGAGAVSQFIEDEYKRLWAVSLERRLGRYEPEADTFSYMLFRNEDPYAFHSGRSGEEYPVAIRDREGYFWVGNDNGIHIFHPTRQQVRTIREHAAAQRESSLVNDIFQATDGDVYVSHWHGRLQRFSPDFREKQVYQNKTDRKFWQSNGLYSVEQDTLGRIWIGEENGWISLLDARGRKLSPLHCVPCRGSRIRNIVRARNGDMWLNLARPAIARWQPGRSRFEVFELPMSSNSTTYSLLEDDKGNIWVGTAGQGLLCFDPVSQRVTARYYDHSSPETAYPDNDIAALFQLNNDTLLVGTEHGLKYLDLKNKRYRPHPLSALFPSPHIYGILKDHGGNIWFMTHSGIFWADQALTRIRRFGAGEGFVEDNFRPRGFCLLRDGRFAAGTREGSVVVFHPDSLLQPEKTPPAPVITDVKIFGKPWLIDSLLYQGQPGILAHKQNAVTFFFGILTYSRPGITYQYRLIGLSDEWTDAGVKREANFSFLLPGTYTFEVRAYDRENDVSPLTAFTFIIRPPWWETRWFQLLLAIILLSVAYALVRDRVWRFRERERYEKRLSDLQNQALRAQINPHFIFNALQSVKKFVLLNDVDQAEHYMSRFARLMRQIMDNSRESTVSLRKELDLLDNYLQLEQLRFGHRFDYRFELESDVHPDDLVTPSMTLQPFVENAVLHGLAHLTGRRGLLQLRCSLRDGGLLIEIEDNGVGRVRAEELKNPLRREQHRSAGMEITRKRLKLFSADNGRQAWFAIHDLYDDSGDGLQNARGTLVVIWLPED